MRNINIMPTIIDEPGMYQTRNGFFVTIHEIKYPPNHQEGTISFPCKGSIWTKKIGQLNPPYGIWHISGCAGVFELHPNDIVRKVVNQSEKVMTMSRNIFKELLLTNNLIVDGVNVSDLRNRIIRRHLFAIELLKTEFNYDVLTVDVYDNDTFLQKCLNCAINEFEFPNWINRKFSEIIAFSENLDEKNNAVVYLETGKVIAKHLKMETLRQCKPAGGYKWITLCGRSIKI